jgi:TonB family protein
MHNFQRSFAAAVGAFVLAAAWMPALAKADQPTYYEPPKFKLQVKPNYPESARAAHEIGTVFVKVLVATDGSAKQIIIAKSSGHKDLDAEVLRVAKLSKYYPATRDSKPTVAFYDFSYNFTLAGLTETAAQTSDLSKKLAANPKDVPARLGVINFDINKKDYTQAESLADEGVKLLPSDARLWAARGNAYYQDGSESHQTATLKTAVDSYEQALKLNPKVAPAGVVSASYAEYAFALWQSQQFDACIPYADKAASMNPKAWQYSMLKGDCESGAQNFKAALADYQAAQQADDKKSPELTSRLLASMGNAQLGLGDETAGLQSINQAERLSPKSPFAYQYLASYYITKGNLNAALNPLLQLAQVQPNNVQVQINIGDIYVRQKNYTAAQAAYDKALEIDPKSGDAQFGLAEMAAAKGDPKSADAALQKAVSLAPSNAALYNATLAQLFLNATTDKEDHTADAEKYADAATKADPNYAMAWYSLGIAYADQKKKDQANSALRKAFDLFKAKNDQSGMEFVNKAWVQINGKDNSLISGAGTSEKTNQPGNLGPGGGGG